MQHKSLSTVSALLITILLFFSPAVSFTEQTDTERLIRRMTPPEAIVKESMPPDLMYFDAYYEPSSIVQGNRTGHWSELTGTYGYTHGKVTGYAAISRYQRFDDSDFSAVIGAYFNMPDSYIHSEIGAGWYVDYIYHFQVITEYGHKILENLYGQMGFNFRDYSSGNTYVAYPGLIYYFGNSYLAADYGAIFIQNRGTGNFGTFKGDFAITDFLHMTSSATVGQWLYDIYGLAPSKEFGYILSIGLNMKVYKGINARVGYSYSAEDPKFIKRSMQFGLSARF